MKRSRSFATWLEDPFVSDDERPSSSSTVATPPLKRSNSFCILARSSNGEVLFPQDLTPVAKAAPPTACVLKPLEIQVDETQVDETQVDETRVSPTPATASTAISTPAIEPKLEPKLEPTLVSKPKDDLLNLVVWHFRGYNDVDLRRCGIGDSPVPNKFSRKQSIEPCRCQRICEFYKRQCEAFDNIRFDLFCATVDCDALMTSACLCLLRWPRNYLGITTGCKWRMRYCDSHEHTNMQSHEARGFTITQALAVGTGAAMKYWERIAVEALQNSKLAERLENSKTYRARPIRDTDRVWMYLVSAWQ